MPFGPDGDTFKWVLGPPSEWPVNCTRYIDGSLYDESRLLGRRTGFAIVVVGEDGTLLAAGLGIPPKWIIDAAGAELWAIVVVARMNPWLPRVVTDCKGVVDGLIAGFTSMSGPDRKLARTWCMLGKFLDFDFSGAASQVIWMPSHCPMSAIGVALDSRRKKISAVMWRANRLVDFLAKAAAAPHRLPGWFFKSIGTATDLVKHSAALLGIVAHAANNHRVDRPDEEGVVKTVVLRDSTAQARPSQRTGLRKRAAADEAPGPPRKLAKVSVSPPTADTDCAGRKKETNANARSSAAAVCRARGAAADCLRVERWLSSRSLATAAGPTAKERIDALRARRQLDVKARG